MCTNQQNDGVVMNSDRPTGLPPSLQELLTRDADDAVCSLTAEDGLRLVFESCDDGWVYYCSEAPYIGLRKVRTLCEILPDYEKAVNFTKCD